MRMTGDQIKAARLRQARIRAGFRFATDAAKSLGVANPTYTAHENGSRDFDSKSAATYARRFRVSVEWLLYGTGSSTQETPEQSAIVESDLKQLDPKMFELIEYVRIHMPEEYEAVRQTLLQKIADFAIREMSDRKDRD